LLFERKEHNAPYSPLKDQGWDNAISASPVGGAFSYTRNLLQQVHVTHFTYDQH